MKNLLAYLTVFLAFNVAFGQLKTPDEVMALAAKKHAGYCGWSAEFSLIHNLGGMPVPARGKIMGNGSKQIRAEFERETFGRSTTSLLVVDANGVSWLETAEGRSKTVMRAELKKLMSETSNQ